MEKFEIDKFIETYVNHPDSSAAIKIGELENLLAGFEQYLTEIKANVKNEEIITAIDAESRSKNINQVMNCLLSNAGKLYLQKANEKSLIDYVKNRARLLDLQLQINQELYKRTQSHLFKSFDLNKAREVINGAYYSSDIKMVVFHEKGDFNFYEQMLALDNLDKYKAGILVELISSSPRLTEQERYDLLFKYLDKFKSLQINLNIAGLSGVFENFFGKPINDLKNLYIVDSVLVKQFDVDNKVALLVQALKNLYYESFRYITYPNSISLAKAEVIYYVLNLEIRSEFPEIQDQISRNILEKYISKSTVETVKVDVLIKLVEKTIANSGEDRIHVNESIMSRIIYFVMKNDKISLEDKKKIFASFKYKGESDEFGEMTISCLSSIILKYPNSTEHQKYKDVFGEDFQISLNNRLELNNIKPLPSLSQNVIKDTDINVDLDITLATGYTTDNYHRSKMSKKVAENQQNYARRHDYTYLEYKENLAIGYEPYWSKIAIINKWLADNQSDNPNKWLVWLDDDMIIMDSSIKVEDLINKCAKNDKSVIVAKDALSWKDNNPEISINTGIVFVKNTQESRELFKEIWRKRNDEFISRNGIRTTLGKCPDQICFHEQAAMADLLKYGKNKYNYVSVIDQRGTDNIGVNTFIREKSYYLKRTSNDRYITEIDYSGDPRYSIASPGDFAAQCTGIPVEGKRKKGEDDKYLRLETAEVILKAVNALTDEDKKQLREEADLNISPLLKEIKNAFLDRDFSKCGKLDQAIDKILKQRSNNYAVSDDTIKIEYLLEQQKQKVNTQAINDFNGITIDLLSSNKAWFGEINNKIDSNSDPAYREKFIELLKARLSELGANLLFEKRLIDAANALKNINTILPETENELEKYFLENHFNSIQENEFKAIFSTIEDKYSVIDVEKFKDKLADIRISLKNTGQYVAFVKTVIELKENNYKSMVLELIETINDVNVTLDDLNVAAYTCGLDQNNQVVKEYASLMALATSGAEAFLVFKDQIKNNKTELDYIKQRFKVADNVEGLNKSKSEANQLLLEITDYSFEDITAKAHIDKAIELKDDLIRDLSSFIANVESKILYELKNSINTKIDLLNIEGQLNDTNIELLRNLLTQVPPENDQSISIIKELNSARQKAQAIIDFYETIQGKITNYNNKDLSVQKILEIEQDIKPPAGINKKDKIIKNINNLWITAKTDALNNRFNKLKKEIKAEIDALNTHPSPVAAELNAFELTIESRLEELKFDRFSKTDFQQEELKILKNSIDSAERDAQAKIDDAALQAFNKQQAIAIDKVVGDFNKITFSGDIKKLFDELNDKLAVNFNDNATINQACCEKFIELAVTKLAEKAADWLFEKRLEEAKLHLQNINSVIPEENKDIKQYFLKHHFSEINGNSITDDKITNLIEKFKKAWSITEDKNKIISDLEFQDKFKKQLIKIKQIESIDARYFVYIDAVNNRNKEIKFKIAADGYAEMISKDSVTKGQIEQGSFLSATVPDSQFIRDIRSKVSLIQNSARLFLDVQQQITTNNEELNDIKNRLEVAEDSQILNKIKSEAEALLKKVNVELSKDITVLAQKTKAKELKDGLTSNLKLIILKIEDIIDFYKAIESKIGYYANQNLSIQEILKIKKQIKSIKKPEGIKHVDQLWKAAEENALNKRFDKLTAEINGEVKNLQQDPVPIITNFESSIKSKLAELESTGFTKTSNQLSRLDKLREDIKTAKQAAEIKIEETNLRVMVQQKEATIKQAEQDFKNINQHVKLSKNVNNWISEVNKKINNNDQNYSQRFIDLATTALSEEAVNWFFEKRIDKAIGELKDIKDCLSENLIDIKKIFLEKHFIEIKDQTIDDKEVVDLINEFKNKFLTSQQESIINKKFTEKFTEKFKVLFAKIEENKLIITNEKYNKYFTAIKLRNQEIEFLANLIIKTNKINEEIGKLNTADDLSDAYIRELSSLVNPENLPEIMQNSQSIVQGYTDLNLAKNNAQKIINFSKALWQYKTDIDKELNTLEVDFNKVDNAKTLNDMYFKATELLNQVNQKTFNHSDDVQVYQKEVAKLKTGLIDKINIFINKCKNKKIELINKILQDTTIKEYEKYHLVAENIAEEPKVFIEFNDNYIPKLAETNDFSNRDVIGDGFILIKPDNPSNTEQNKLLLSALKALYIPGRLLKNSQSKDPEVFSNILIQILSRNSIDRDILNKFAGNLIYTKEVFEKALFVSGLQESIKNNVLKIIINHKYIKDADKYQLISPYINIDNKITFNKEELNKLVSICSSVGLNPNKDYHEGFSKRIVKDLNEIGDIGEFNNKVTQFQSIIQQQQILLKNAKCLTDWQGVNQKVTTLVNELQANHISLIALLKNLGNKEPLPIMPTLSILDDINIRKTEILKSLVNLGNKDVLDDICGTNKEHVVCKINSNLRYDFTKANELKSLDEIIKINLDVDLIVLSKLEKILKSDNYQTVVDSIKTLNSADFVSQYKNLLMADKIKKLFKEINIITSDIFAENYQTKEIDLEKLIDAKIKKSEILALFKLSDLNKNDLKQQIINDYNALLLKFNSLTEKFDPNIEPKNFVDSDQIQLKKKYLGTKYENIYNEKIQQLDIEYGLALKELKSNESILKLQQAKTYNDILQHKNDALIFITSDDFINKYKGLTKDHFVLIVNAFENQAANNIAIETNKQRIEIEAEKIAAQYFEYIKGLFLSIDELNNKISRLVIEDIKQNISAEKVNLLDDFTFQEIFKTKLNDLYIQEKPQIIKSRLEQSAESTLKEKFDSEIRDMSNGIANKLVSRIDLFKNIVLKISDDIDNNPGVYQQIMIKKSKLSGNDLTDSDAKEIILILKNKLDIVNQEITQDSDFQKFEFPRLDSPIVPSIFSYLAFFDKVREINDEIQITQQVEAKVESVDKTINLVLTSGLSDIDLLSTRIKKLTNEIKLLVTDKESKNGDLAFSIKRANNILKFYKKTKEMIKQEISKHPIVYNAQLEEIDKLRNELSENDRSSKLISELNQALQNKIDLHTFNAQQSLAIAKVADDFKNIAFSKDIKKLFDQLNDKLRGKFNDDDKINQACSKKFIELAAIKLAEEAVDWLFEKRLEEAKLDLQNIKSVMPEQNKDVKQYFLEHHFSEINSASITDDKITGLISEFEDKSKIGEDKNSIISNQKFLDKFQEKLKEIKRIELTDKKYSAYINAVKVRNAEINFQEKAVARIATLSKDEVTLKEVNNKLIAPSSSVVGSDNLVIKKIVDDQLTPVQIGAEAFVKFKNEITSVSGKLTELKSRQVNSVESLNVVKLDAEKLLNSNNLILFTGITVKAHIEKAKKLKDDLTKDLKEFISSVESEIKLYELKNAINAKIDLLNIASQLNDTNIESLRSLLTQVPPKNDQSISIVKELNSAKQKAQAIIDFYETIQGKITNYNNKDLSVQKILEIEQDVKPPAGINKKDKIIKNINNLWITAKADALNNRFNKLKQEIEATINDLNKKLNPAPADLIAFELSVKSSMEELEFTRFSKTVVQQEELGNLKNSIGDAKSGAKAKITDAQLQAFNAQQSLAIAKVADDFKNIAFSKDIKKLFDQLNDKLRGKFNDDDKINQACSKKFIELAAIKLAEEAVDWLFEKRLEEAKLDLQNIKSVMPEQNKDVKQYFLEHHFSEINGASITDDKIAGLINEFKSKFSIITDKNNIISNQKFENKFKEQLESIKQNRLTEENQEYDRYVTAIETRNAEVRRISELTTKINNIDKAITSFLSTDETVCETDIKSLENLLIVEPVQSIDKVDQIHWLVESLKAAQEKTKKIVEFYNNAQEYIAIIKNINVKSEEVMAEPKAPCFAENSAESKVIKRIVDQQINSVKNSANKYIEFKNAEKASEASVKSFEMGSILPQQSAADNRSITEFIKSIDKNIKQLNKAANFSVIQTIITDKEVAESKFDDLQLDLNNKLQKQVDLALGNFNNNLIKNINRLINLKIKAIKKPSVTLAGINDITKEVDNFEDLANKFGLEIYDKFYTIRNEVAANLRFKEHEFEKEKDLDERINKINEAIIASEDIDNEEEKIIYKDLLNKSKQQAENLLDFEDAIDNLEQALGIEDIPDLNQAAEDAMEDVLADIIVRKDKKSARKKMQQQILRAGKDANTRLKAIAAAPEENVKLEVVDINNAEKNYKVLFEMANANLLALKEVVEKLNTVSQKFDKLGTPKTKLEIKPEIKPEEPALKPINTYRFNNKND